MHHDREKSAAAGFFDGRLWSGFLRLICPRRIAAREALGGAHDDGQAQSVLLHAAILRAAVAGDGGCPFRRIVRARTRAPGASAAELCAADRATLRHLPYRFCRAHPVRPALQDRRLYLWRRPLSYHALPRGFRLKRQEEDLGAADLDAGHRRLHPHAGAAAAPTAPYNANDNVVASPLSFFWGGAITDHLGAFAQVTYNAPGPGGFGSDPFAAKTW